MNTAEVRNFQQVRLLELRLGGNLLLTLTVDGNCSVGGETPKQNTPIPDFPTFNLETY